MFNTSKMHATTQRLFDAVRDHLGLTSEAEPGHVAKLLGETTAVVTNWKSRGVSKDGMLRAHAKAQINPLWISTGQGPSKTDLELAQSAPESAHAALKKKLKDWRMHASPRSVQVIDQLTVLAEKDALREDDWTLIETMARRLKTPS